ncbi:DNA damage-regulated autophagy modulator protein 1 isoform 2-T3 [Menidia menidia]|uniref:(Atlantic silverside) hypothetical protein n=1 Tax=Menidia menidia TaxID=238744 RepID=A0A8S4B7X2_9TELE|nr:unnamed protein product [Menidia menidia]
MFWFTQGLCFLPVFLVIWSSCTFVISYVIALFRQDVDIIFPYISDTGANPPESCIFGLMTFISACAGTATIYARYKFVEKLNEDTRVETAVTPVHDFGALLFFVSGVLYIILQTVMSFQSYPFGPSMAVCGARLGIAVLAAVAFFPTVICAFFVEQTTLHRHAEDKDYPFHLASAVCEWVVAFSFVCFFLTYIDDFKLFTLKVKTEFAE